MLACDDGTLDKSNGWTEYDKEVRAAAVSFGTPLEDPAKFEEWFEDVGFEAVTNERFKIPCNTWPKDKRLKQVGEWERENLLKGLYGMSVRLFHKGLGWTPERVQDLVSRVHSDILNTSIHAYYPM